MRRVVAIVVICAGTLAFILALRGRLYPFCAHNEHVRFASNTNRTFKGERPPVPDFYDPVDYVAWCNSFLAAGKSDESIRIYDGFWRYHGDEECMPDPSKPVAKQLRKLSAGPTWRKGQYPEVENYMEDVAEYVERFKKATRSKEYALQLMHDPETPNVGSLPWTVSGEYAVCVLLAKSWQAKVNQFEDIYNAWQVGLKHVNHLQRSRTLIPITRSSFVQLIILRSARNAVDTGVIDIDDSRKVLDLLGRSTPESFSLTEGIYSEWAAALGLIQELYAGGHLNKRYAELFAGLDVDTLRRSNVKPPVLVIALDKYFSKLLHISDQPMSIKLLEDIRTLQDQSFEDPLSNHPLRSLIFPRMERPVLLQLEALASLRATVTILLLHDYHLRHDAWPNSLSELKFTEHADYLIDPFSGDEFIYRTTGESFLLYTVSGDKNDNGGKHAAWGRWTEIEDASDFVFWPIQQQQDF